MAEMKDTAHENRFAEAEFRLKVEREVFDRRRESLTTVTRLIFQAILIFGLLYLFFEVVTPVRALLQQQHDILAAEAEGMKKIPDIKKEIEVLEGQLARLTSQSVENRLSTIEKAIRLGKVSARELTSLQEIRNDVQVLKSYLVKDPEELLNLKQLQRDYREICDNQEKYMTKEVIQREIGFTQNLFYASLALFGILVSIFGGSFILVRRQKQ